MHFACRGGHKELAILLIEKGIFIISLFIHDIHFTYSLIHIFIGGLLNIQNKLGDVPLTYCDERFRNELQVAADKARLHKK